MITSLFYKGTSFFIGNVIKSKETGEETSILNIYYNNKLGEYRFITSRGETGPGYVTKVTKEDREIGSVA